jgi:hypothetical protein
MNMLLMYDVFGINIEESEKNYSTAFLRICVEALIVFITETLPIQLSLDDEFMNHFTTKSRRLEGVSTTIIQEVKKIDELQIIKDSQHANTVLKTHEEEKAKMDGESEIKKRQTFKAYAAMKMSVEEIRTRLKSRLIDSAQFKLEEIIASSANNKLGKVYSASPINNYALPPKMAIRVIEFAKMPSYIIEDLYLELCYRSENHFDVLVPLIALVCESPKLYIVMPKYQFSLHHLIYQSSMTPPEKLRLIKYFPYYSLKAET